MLQKTPCFLLSKNGRFDSTLTPCVSRRRDASLFPPTSSFPKFNTGRSPPPSNTAPLYRPFLGNPELQGPRAVEIAVLANWEEQPATRGKSEGQVQVFERAGKAIAAQRSAASSTWIEVGEVVGASEADQVDGEPFDRVYPIEVEGVGGAVRNLQIGHNNGQNPSVAAQNVIDKNELPQSYLND
ncbi:unnamed protein product, partial [Ectocarpus sp. 4 AP-2014]